MRGSRREVGFTIIELLVTGVILVVLLGIVGNYFVQQSKLNRQTQAASEVQDKVRLVMQLVTQDLQLGGASTYASSDGTVLTTGTALSSCPSNGTVQTCLEAANGDAKDTFSTVYINTLRPAAEACREVGYRFSGDTLQRADRVCSGGADLIDPATDGDAFADVASDILALDIEYKCSNGSTLASYPSSADCPLREGYLRSAVVTVVGRADQSTQGTAQRTYTTVSDQSVTCPQDYRCFSMEQEVLTPNFKDR